MTLLKNLVEMSESESPRHAQTKKVSFADWMGSDEEPVSGSKGDKKGREDDYDKVFAEDKFSKREKKGHLLL